MVYFEKADKVLGSLMAIVSCIAVVGRLLLVKTI